METSSGAAEGQQAKWHAAEYWAICSCPTGQHGQKYKQLYMTEAADYLNTLEPSLKAARAALRSFVENFDHCSGVDGAFDVAWAHATAARAYFTAHPEAKL